MFSFTRRYIIYSSENIHFKIAFLRDSFYSFFIQILKNTFEKKMNKQFNYQGVRVNYNTKKEFTMDHLINYPGVRSKGSSTKVVRVVSNQGKVYPVLSWTADISEEKLAKELELKNK